MKISSWSRMAPNTLPAMAKSTANYANSALIKMEALADGYAEGIALDVYGNVSEGSGQNMFAVRDDAIYTPPISASILGGITRDSIITLAADLGFKVIETDLPRESLYIADEVFCVGTAAEVTPIRSIDKITIGAGRRGPITQALQQRVFRRRQRHGCRYARLAHLRVPGGERHAFQLSRAGRTCRLTALSMQS